MPPAAASPVSLRRLGAFLAFALLAACAPRMIPNTEIPDTPEDRAIMDVAQRYRSAFEAKDAAMIMALASPRYLDSRDSISYEMLQKQLQEYFDKVSQAHLDLSPRRIVVEGDKARLDYIFALHYILNTTDPKWRSQTDDKRMTLERVNGAWKVTSGF